MRVEMKQVVRIISLRGPLGVNITHYSDFRVVNLGLSLNVYLREPSNT